MDSTLRRTKHGSAENYVSRARAGDEYALSVRAVIERHHDMRFLRTEKFECGPNSSEVAIFEHDTGLEFVVVPSGEFSVKFDGKAETVEISSFLIARTPYVEDGTVRVSISWTQSREICEQNSWHLPSENEWEYACRAGSDADYCYGDDVNRLHDYAVFGGSRSYITGTKRPNAFGLYHMHGLVWEWCQDSWQPSRVTSQLPRDDAGVDPLRRASASNFTKPVRPTASSEVGVGTTWRPSAARPTGSGTGRASASPTWASAPQDRSDKYEAGASLRVHRGGCWSNSASYCRSAYRVRVSPGVCDTGLGFRPARSI